MCKCILRAMSMELEIERQGEVHLIEKIKINE
jgi:hypothetical protein